MKNILVRGAIGIISLILIVLVGCNNDLVNPTEPNKPVVITDQDGYTLVQTALGQTRLHLYSGVATDDIGLSFEERTEKLALGLSAKNHRSVDKSDITTMTVENLTTIIQINMDAIVLPELVEPTENDIATIQRDFPDLSPDDIITNLEVIRRIYQDQIGALSMNALLEASDTASATTSRSAGYKEGAFYFDDSEITVYEIGAMLSHPLSAIGLYSQRKKAMDLTEKYMGARTRTDDKSDAFRHAIWNIVMAKEGWGLKGEKMAWARDFSTAHEKGKKYEAVSSEMDLHNNTVGLRYYNSKSSRNYTTILWVIKIETGVSEPSYDTVASDMKIRAKQAVLVNRIQTNNDTAAKSKVNAVGTDTLVYIKVDTNSY